MRRVLSSAMMAAVMLVVFILGPGFARAQDSVTLRTDWTIFPHHLPFYLALARGYYKEANLDVKIFEGKGSNTTVQLVGNGSDTFGFADAAAAAKSISVGLPVKVVMGIIQRNTGALVFPADRGIRTPQDLKGKTISVCAGDGPSIVLPAYLRAVNLSLSDIKLVTVDCSAKYPIVVQGRADAAASYGPAGKTVMENAGHKGGIGLLDYADAGIFLPSHGIVASLKTIETRSDMVRRFVAATARGWVEARKNPDAAVEAGVSSFTLLKGREQRYKAGLEDYLRYLDTPGTVGKPFGWQSAEEWTKAEAIMVQYMDLKPQSSVNVYFTNDFIPK